MDFKSSKSEIDNSDSIDGLLKKPQQQSKWLKSANKDDDLKKLSGSVESKSGYKDLLKKDAKLAEPTKQKALNGLFFLTNYFFYFVRIISAYRQICHIYSY